MTKPTPIQPPIPGGDGNPKPYKKFIMYGSIALVVIFIIVSLINRHNEAKTEPVSVEQQ